MLGLVLVYLLFFFVLIGAVNEESAPFFGIVFLIAGLLINLAIKKEMSIYLSQLLFIMSIVGYVLLGIFFLEQQWDAKALLMMVVATFYLIFHKQYIHKFIAFYIFIGTSIFVFAQLGGVEDYLMVLLIVMSILSTYLWLKESAFKTKNHSEIRSVVKYASTTIFLLLAIYKSFDETMIMNTGRLISDLSLWLISTGLFLIISYVTVQIESHLKIAWYHFISLGLLSVLLLVAVLFYQTPALIAAIIVLIIGIERGSKILVPLAVVTLIFSLIKYYYFLEITLMQKSFLLMASGGVLLLASFIVMKQGGRSHD